VLLLLPNYHLFKLTLSFIFGGSFRFWAVNAAGCLRSD
jgi:hypothetical protein